MARKFATLLFTLAYISFIANQIWCLPTKKRFMDEEYEKLANKEKLSNEIHSDRTYYMEDLQLEYTRYLQQVLETLENDEEFKKKLEDANEADIRSAKIAEELEYVNHHVRSKLDELKRIELERLKKLAEQTYGKDGMNSEPPAHVDHHNPDHFEIKDLKKLIKKVAEDLEKADILRKESFKQYEMQKQYEHQQQMQHLTPEDRDKFIDDEYQYAKQREQMKEKNPIQHPISKKQLEDVWEKQDHMDRNDFNPRTFFAMHDLDSNGFLDENEVKALFLRELDKLYDKNLPKTDFMERAEEMERMREHVFQEVDLNKDRLISWYEFYAMSMKPEFNEDPGWKALDEQKIYSAVEMREFEIRRQKEVEQMIKEGKLQMEYHPPPPPIHNNYGYNGHNAPNQYQYMAAPHQQQSQPPHNVNFQQQHIQQQPPPYQNPQAFHPQQQQHAIHTQQQQPVYAQPLQTNHVQPSPQSQQPPQQPNHAQQQQQGKQQPFDVQPSPLISLDEQKKLHEDQMKDEIKVPETNKVYSANHK